MQDAPGAREPSHPSPALHSFPVSWTAEILAARPPILPARHFVYPALVEEVERGALELQVRPAAGLPFLATFALGFASPAVPTGVWSCPNPDFVCAVAGGYAYLVNTQAPATEWTQLRYRPVTAVCAVPPFAGQPHGLLVFASFHRLLAWGAEGQVWESARLSSEGLRLTGVEGAMLRGCGWDWKTDREVEFVLDLRSGRHTGGAAT